MASRQPSDAPPSKRRKLDDDSSSREVTKSDHHAGLNKPISPPLPRRKSPEPPSFTPTWSFDGVPKPALASGPAKPATPHHDGDRTGEPRYCPSPIQLTKIEKLPAHQNVDAVCLSDLLGDPLIKECWNFNFLFDLDFVMQHFDSDVRDMIKVKIVHGFWKRDDGNRIALLETAERYPNIELLSAYIPDPFGTHHTKMLILFRHDDTAQIIIHTANMIYRDWANMTQAVWKSPLLPVLVQATPSQPDSPQVHPIGSGERFKVDILRYLSAYEKRLRGLTTQLRDYDFSSIRAAFIGSAPSRQKPAAVSPSVTSFGWLGLREVLSSVPVTGSRDSVRPHIVTQISSIATLGAAPTWLSNFQSVLASHSATAAANSGEQSPSSTQASSFFAKRELNVGKSRTPKYSVIFPTPEEIRGSLDGYASGGSIHWKLQSAQQQKQLEYMHPMLCHWSHASSSSSNGPARQEAHRGSAAPHIKTYIRFSDEEHKTIDWAMVTSANLSKQAWGDVVNKKDEIWIQSWEAGVVVWPALCAQTQEEVIMVPVFGEDMPGPESLNALDDGSSGTAAEEKKMTVVGCRMAYDLPLRSYTADERPWCATMQYMEPDREGHAWAGYGR